MGRSPSVLWIGVALAAAALLAVQGWWLRPSTAVRGCYPSAVPPPTLVEEAPLARFIVMGDFGMSGNRGVAQALQQFIATSAPPPVRVFELGDNFYEYGLVGAVDSCDEIPSSIKRIEKQALRVLEPFQFLHDQHITLTVIPGNHDYRCFGQGVANEVHIDQWLPPARHWKKRWDFIYGLPREIVLANGAVQVVTLDSERMLAHGDFRRQSAERLRSLLAKGRDRYRWHILVAHHPLRTNGLKNGADFMSCLRKLMSFVLLPSHLLAAMQIEPFSGLNQNSYSLAYHQYREAVEDAVADGGTPVSLFMGGHDHQLQLLAPSTTGQPYIVVSGSAARCDPVRARDDTIFAAPKNGFVVVTASLQHIDLDFIGTTSCEDREPCGHSSTVQPHALFHYSIPAP